MGFKELISSSTYTTNRVVVDVQTPGGGQVQSSTTLFGSTYVLLGVSATKECRVRLYSTSASMALDTSRSTASFAIDPAVGLNLEAYLSTSQLSLKFDPPVIGTSFDGSETWYTVSSSIGNPSVQVTAYPIEFENIIRQELRVTRSVSTGIAVSGSFATPKSFLILSGSSNVLGRLRLYSTTVDSLSTVEKTRTFGTQPPTGSKLISDLMFDSASFAYKINPVLEAYTWTGIEYTEGTGVVHYILENLSGTSPASMTASLQIISLED